MQAYEARLEFDAVIYCPMLVKSRAVEVLVRRTIRAGAQRGTGQPRAVPSVCTLERAPESEPSSSNAGPRSRRLSLQRGLCWIVVEAIHSPGNLGTILRTAEACSVAGVIFVGPHTDPYHPTVVRASMGGIGHLALVRTSHAELAAWVL